MYRSGSARAGRFGRWIIDRAANRRQGPVPDGSRKSPARGTVGACRSRDCGPRFASVDFLRREPVEIRRRDVRGRLEIADRWRARDASDPVYRVPFIPRPRPSSLFPLAPARGQDAKAKESGHVRGRRPATRILEDLLAAHNKVRAEEKLPPLKLNDQLTQAARGHARDMAEHNKLTHEGSDGSDPKTRIKRAGYVYQEIGENVAAGQEAVAEVMRTWIESPPHRENILGPLHRDGGRRREGRGRPELLVRRLRPADAAGGRREEPRRDDRGAEQGPGAGPRRRPCRPTPMLARVAARFAPGRGRAASP